MNNLPLKLAIGIILVFGALLLGFALFPTLRVKWYERNLYSNDARKFQSSLSRLLTLGKHGEAAVHRYFDRDNTGWSRPSSGLVARATPRTYTVHPPKETYIEDEDYKGDIFIEIMNITSRDVEINILRNEFVELVELVLLYPSCDGYSYDETLSRPLIKSPIVIKPGNIYQLPIFISMRVMDRSLTGKGKRTPTIEFWFQQLGYGPLYWFQKKPKEMRVLFVLNIKKLGVHIRTNPVTFHLKWE